MLPRGPLGRLLLAICALAILGAVSFAPDVADARAPTNGRSSTLEQAIRVNADVVRSRRALAALRRGSSSPARIEREARRLRAAAVAAKRLTAGYRRGVARGRPTASPKEATLLVATLAELDRAMGELEKLSGVPTEPPRATTERTRAQPLIRQLLPAAIDRAIGSELAAFGLTTAVLPPTTREELVARLQAEVGALADTELEAAAGDAALESLALNVPLQTAAKRRATQLAGTILSRLVVNGDPVRGWVVRLVGLQGVLDEVAVRSVQVVTWPVDRVASLIRGIGRRSLTLGARANRSAKGLRNRAMTLRCRIRPRADAKVGGGSCKGIRHGASPRQVERLIAQAERTFGRSLQLERDLALSGGAKQITNFTSARSELRNAVAAAQRRYLLDTSLYRDAPENHRLVCVRLDQIRGMISRLGRTAPAPAPAPSTGRDVFVIAGPVPRQGANSVTVELKGWPAGREVQIQVVDANGRTVVDETARTSSSGGLIEFYGVVTTFAPRGQWRASVTVAGLQTVTKTFQVQ